MRRPETVDRILKLLEQRASQQSAYNQKSYEDFVEACGRVEENPDGLSVKMRWHKVGDNAFRSRSNCSLCVIFFFYAKTTPIHAKTSKSDSSQDIDRARQSLTFFELGILCHDFRLTPNIVTREEIHYLWNLSKMEKVRGEQKFQKLMSFDDFQLFLGRVAILAFNKPGLKSLLQEKSGGIEFTSNDLVGFLAHYMHLDNVEWVRHRVRTVGRDTVGMINFRTTGESKNGANFHLLRDNLRGIRLARILAKHPRQVDLVSNNNNQENEIQPINDISRRVVNQLEKKSSSSSTIGQQGIMKPRFGLDTISEASKEDDVSFASEILSNYDRGNSDFCDIMRISSDLVFDAFDEAMEEIRNGAEATLNDLQGFLDLMDGLDLQQVEDKLELKSDALDDSDEKRGGDVVLKGGVIIYSDQISAVREYNPLYYKSSNVLKQYANASLYFQNKNYSESYFDASNESSSGYLDMGALPSGTKAIIRLTITNETAHPVRVSIMSEGISSDVTITSLPKIIAAGLGFHAYVAFTVEEKVLRYNKNAIQLDNVFGSISLKSQWPSEPTMQYFCNHPVFFRVLSQLPEKNSNNPIFKSPSDVISKYPLCCPISFLSIQNRIASSKSCHQHKETEDNVNSVTAFASTNVIQEGAGHEETAARRSDLISVQSSSNESGSVRSNCPPDTVGKRRFSTAPSAFGKDDFESVIRSPTIPDQQKSSSAAAVNSIVRRRFSLSSKMLMKHKKQENNVNHNLTNFIGV